MNLVSNQSKDHRVDSHVPLYPTRIGTLEEKIFGKIMGKPLGRLPSGSRTFYSNLFSNKANDASNRINRYLMIQESRIIKAVNARNYQKAIKIGLILLKNSQGYQISLFNRVMPSGHYMLNMIEAKALLTKICNKCRSNDLGLTLRRFYILKADGKRFRPIGCPDYPSRVISMALNDMIYTIFEDRFTTMQHGFRKKRGTFSAIKEIVEKLKNNPTIIYEFDLKSYFNTVRPSGVYRILLARSPLLAEVVIKILHQIVYELPLTKTKKAVELDGTVLFIFYTFMPVIIISLLGSTNGLMIILAMIISWVVYAGACRISEQEEYKDGRKRIDIKKERELHSKGFQKHLGRRLPYLIREGLPQGLSISPVLATLAMEIFKCPTEITMYADDGVFIGDDFKKFKRGMDDMSLIGVKLADDKSRIVKDRFEFLGIEINIKKRILIYNNAVISFDDDMLEEKLKVFMNVYTKNPKLSGTGLIKNDSVTALNYKDSIDFGHFPIGGTVCIYGYSLMYALPYKGYRGFPNIGIIDIIGASSFACNELSKRRDELNLVAIQPLRPIFSGKLKNFCLLKGNPDYFNEESKFYMKGKHPYFEEIYENSLRDYIKKQPTLKGGNNVLENYFGNDQTS